MIIYGNEFKLRQLCLTVPEQEDGPKAREAAFAAWTDGLLRLTTACTPELYAHECQLEYWLQREWGLLCKNQRGPGLREVKAWLQHVSCKLSNKETKELFSKADRAGRGQCIPCCCREKHLLLVLMSSNDHAGYLSEQEFRHLYWSAANGLAVKLRFAIKDPKGRDELSTADLRAFLRDHQGEDVTLEQCQEIARRYSGPNDRFNLANFAAYLHGADNAGFSPEHRLKVYQSMDHPLAHYFISTSHNTYLFGNQFKSESSFEAYIKCLQDGCRCVELDTWDNPRADDPYDQVCCLGKRVISMSYFFSWPQIIVTHGNTLTTKIKFRDVIPAIMEHAFTASPYPVILSIEQHCGLEQQARMAEIFVKELGAALITTPLPECTEPERDAYPTPEQLKYRIIIKHKKLTDGSEEVSCNINEEDISSAILSGFVSDRSSLHCVITPYSSDFNYVLLYT